MHNFAKSSTRTAPAAQVQTLIYLIIKNEK